MEQTNQNPPTNQNPQAQQPKFKCPGNCLQCQPAQRQYCASQHAYSNMMVLDRMMETLLGMKNQIETMQGSIYELAAKIEAIQSSEAAVFDPNGQAVESELFPKAFAKDAEAAE